MDNLIKKLLRESLKLRENVESRKDFFERFKLKNSNPSFIEDSFKNPEFDFRLSNGGGVVSHNYRSGMRNKCERNVFNFIKNTARNSNRYYPVSGWGFLQSTTYFEHFWVYDSLKDLYIELTPMENEQNGMLYGYGGVINKEINDDILKAENFFDVDFLRGKSSQSLFKNFSDKETNINSISDRSNTPDLFDLIKSHQGYTELKKFIDSEGITSVDELKGEVRRIKNVMDTVRSSREYNFFENLLKQIQSLNDLE